MRFSEIVREAIALLQDSGRLTYRTLKREFDLDDDALEDLKFELITGQELAVDKDGEVLVWVGANATPSPPSATPAQSQSPASYTPSHLAARIRAEQAAMEARGATDGERKTITALFADLKGSTALIEGLDPEDARAIIDPALQLMMDAVHRYDGYVAQALGDGIFALFGAPIAHEDHPQRALYAALRMQEEMRAYSNQSRLKGGIPLQMRVGLNTGEVVVRSIHKDDLHTDYVPVGHSTNLAARMEQLATPGSIVISEYTRKLTEGYFELKALGAAAIKGVEEPLNVYEVLGAGPLRTRFQVTARRGLTRFVGRHSELDQMRQALEQAKAGHGQIVGVMGDPGLGKSRLCYEFKHSSQSGCLVLEAFAVSYGKASPYLPIIELLKTYFDIIPEDDDRKRGEKITGKVLMLDRSLEEIVPYLFALLGIDVPESSLPQMDAQVRRRRTFEALKQLFLRESLNQPLMLIFEDLHWIDVETQGFLDMFSESVASAQLLLLVTYRPEYRPTWGQKSYYTQLRLAPLGQAEAEELLSCLLGNDLSLMRLKALILAKTEGAPFFLEEVVQTLVEEGALHGERGNYRLETTPTELHISPTVQGVLAARIDRLATDEKALLQRLAVIGRQFPLSLVKQVVSIAEADLCRLLSLLQAKEFLYEQPAFPEVEYVFKHALTQEVVYGTVLQEQRKTLHERIGQTMEVGYAENLDDHYSELAHHYSRSGNTEKAVEYLRLAGHQAVHRSAHADAVTQFTAALELLPLLPDSPERLQQELMLQLSLGTSLVVTKGYGAPEVGAVYTQARELCQQIGETAQLFPVLHGLWQFHTVRGEHKTARGLAEQCLSLAHSLQDSALLVAACWALGETLLVLGELASARVHLERGVALYKPHHHHELAFRFGSDPGVFCLTQATSTLWLLGYPDQALRQSQRAVSLAQDLSHPNSLGAALMFAAAVHQYRREGQATQQQAESLLALAHEQEFPFWSAQAAIFQGWALAVQGRGAEGVARLRSGIDACRASGTKIGQSWFLAMLAEAHGKAGQPEEGLRVLAEAAAVVHETGQCDYEAELYRLKGELILNDERGLRNDESKTQKAEVRPQAADAESCFHTALGIARQQQAKSWELRAATSLARLWQQQGKTTEARALLTPVYAWFTEGFDTQDLKDAKTVLGELG